MVYGIRQRLEKSNLVDDVIDFCEVTSSLPERHLSSYQLGIQRIFFIPCQWRKGLQLSSEHAVDKITLDGVRKLRVMLNAIVYDVLYYMSPIYCQAIIDSVSNQLHMLYLKFLKRNLGYDGKILSSPFPMEFIYKEQDIDEISYPNVNGLSNDGNLTFNLEDKSITNFANESRAGFTDKKETSIDPCFLGLIDGHDDQISGNLLDPSVLAVSENRTPIDFAKRESNSTSLSDQTLSEPHRDISNLNLTNEPMISENEVAGCSEQNVDEEVPVIDKGKIIELLKEEINLLKAKIKELEVDHDLGNMEKVIVQPIPGRLHAEPRDASKSYTPYIKYTKLRFKVTHSFLYCSHKCVFLFLLLEKPLVWFRVWDGATLHVSFNDDCQYIHYFAIKHIQ